MSYYSEDIADVADMHSNPSWSWWRSAGVPAALSALQIPLPKHRQQQQEGVSLCQGEKYFRGSSRFNVNKRDQGQVNPAQCPCFLWPVAPAGSRYPCSKMRLLCFSCFCLFWSLGLLGLLCGSFRLNKLSSPLVLSQWLVGAHGIIFVYR